MKKVEHFPFLKHIYIVGKKTGQNGKLFGSNPHYIVETQLKEFYDGTIHYTT